MYFINPLHIFKQSKSFFSGIPYFQCHKTEALSPSLNSL